MVKKSLFLILLFISSVFIIAIASANLLDNLFGPKVDLGPVTVGVDIQNSPPTIKRFSLVPAFPQPYTPTAGLGAWVYLAFVAEDVNGVADLPQGASISAPSVNAEILAPLSSINPSIVRTSLNCGSIPCNDVTTLGALGISTSICNAPSIQIVYVCQNGITYADPPSTSLSANDLWRMRISVIDLSTNPSPTVTSGDPGFNNLPNDYIQINALSAYKLETSSINWAGLSLTTPNQPATAPIIISNEGNTPLNTIQVTGSNLIGTINPSAILSTAAFSSGGVNGGIPDASCVVSGGSPTAIALQNGVSVTAPGVSIPYTTSGSTVDRDNLYVCAYQLLNNPGILTGGSSITYAGTWQITAI